VEALKIYKCSMPSSIDKICYVIRDIIKYLEGLYGQIDQNILFEIKVILNELLLNAIIHGNEKDYNKNVKITVVVGKFNDAYFIIEDEGQGYNCRFAIEGAESDMCGDDIFNMRETGRGLILVENLCNSVRFNKKGNRVVVKKNL
jgi:serine/threonine-protein kinase RsbW